MEADPAEVVHRVVLEEDPAAAAPQALEQEGHPGVLEDPQAVAALLLAAAHLVVVAPREAQEVQPAAPEAPHPVRVIPAVQAAPQMVEQEGHPRALEDHRGAVHRLVPEEDPAAAALLEAREAPLAAQAALQVVVVEERRLEALEVAGTVIPAVAGRVPRSVPIGNPLS